MVQSVKAYLSSLIPLPDEDMDTILGLMKSSRIRKKELLVHAGELCNKIAFFDSGYFRFFHTRHDGEEITSDFPVFRTFLQHPLQPL